MPLPSRRVSSDDTETAPIRTCLMSKLTPMMQQYTRIKAEHDDAILLFRMGDFYETFFEDAKVASRVLGLALTTRDKGSANPVPLAGLPHHALESYLGRLVAAGYKVAICDQIEDPKSAKGIVKRAITEIITPGTILSSSMLDERRSNVLLSVLPDGDVVGLAAVDLSTGEFTASEVAPDALRRETLRTDPSEIVIPESIANTEPLASLRADLDGVPFTPIAEWEFALESAHKALTRHFGVANLDGFGLADMTAAIRAAGAAISYLKDLKRRDLKQLTAIRTSAVSDHMVLDETSQRNLELVEPLEHGLAEATLLAVLDRTVTAMGARMLRQWVLYPLMEASAIRARLDSVAAIMGARQPSDRLRDTLADVCDIPRVAGRTAAGQAGPRELIALRRSLEAIPSITAELETVGAPTLLALRGDVPDMQAVAARVAETLVDDPPASLRKGGVIRAGVSDELDEVHTIAREGKGWISRLQTTERETTGIPNLKIGYNKVFGYYIEVTKTHSALVPEHYTRKQTLVNAERYITPDLKEYESRVITAEEDMVRLETEIFESLRDEIAGETARLQAAATALARLDCLLSLARVAVDNRYVRPDIEDSGTLEIAAGRHPVVEQLLASECFVPNDASLDVETRQVLLITGPNMAGKSTYLRQIALIVIMAQMGSFVPADSARIGLVDRVFTRVGATDALARGRSTFLVEMSETANILHHATERSLILLDEIGRGTSTFDGLSIAWAVTEYLHNSPGSRAKTLFATHYHELTELADILPRVENVQSLARETGDTIVFLHRIGPGSADQSYGIEVARLAGIPDEVIVRAREVLANLEAAQYTSEAVPRLAEGVHGPFSASERQIPLFPTPSAIEGEIGELAVNDMTPLEALSKLAELKERVQGAKQDPDTE